jgi:hypothetical protein
MDTMVVDDQEKGENEIASNRNDDLRSESAAVNR